MKSHRIAYCILATICVAVLIAGCGSSEQAPPAAPTGAVLLADSLSTMRPQSVWQHFYDITQVPRPSHHEEKATEFVSAFGRGLGLETVVDDAGNVIIRKPATAGMEDRPGVVLQAHLDMVPQKTETSTVNFETDPVTPYVDNGWVHADGTTLGADDGIGVAMIMAILEAKDIVHGPIEALFTVDEEDGFDGINGLSAKALTGRLYINVDNEVEGQFLISSAGGVYVDSSKKYAEVDTPSGMSGFSVTVDGLAGGHSGADINKGRGSAHQLIARLLVDAPAELGIRVASLTGGNLANAIPRAATAALVVPTAQADALASYVSEFGKVVASELATSDPKVAVSCDATDLPVAVMSPAEQKALIGAVYDVPQGVYRMSAEVPGLVETSGNLGVLSIAKGAFAGTVYVRSAIDSERDAEAKRFAGVFEKAGAKVDINGAYSSWPPNPDSPLLALMEQVYTTTFGVEPSVEAIHAGLETSVAGVKYPSMDMISVGPTLLNVHSPDERLEVASVSKAYDLIVATLKQIE